MGGFLGIGGSAAKTDRGAQLGARQGLWNVFNYTLPQGQQQQGTGQQSLATATQTLQPAQSYWQRLLQGGRADTAALSAPAISAAQAGSDAQARQAATIGTSRTGGAAAANAEAPAQTQQNIDQIINQNLVGGRQAGAEGLEKVSGEQAKIGDVQLANSLRLLGLSDDAVNQIMTNADTSRLRSNQLSNEAISGYGQAIGSVLGAFGI